MQQRTSQTLQPEDCPPIPRSLAETGLRRELILELVLKTVYLCGECTGQEIARALKLPHGILEESFSHLRSEKFLEVRGLDGPAKSTFRYQLTEAGRRRAREFFERSHYAGPAPVTLDEYSRWVRQQSVLGLERAPDFLRRALGHLVVSDAMVDALGPAVLSGRSLFLYGPAGNGKTVLAEAIASSLGGAIFVPHAIEVDGEIVKVFDHVYHRPVELKRRADEPMRQRGTGHDARWVLTKRPVVVTGGELTPFMLDLQFNAVSRYYEAPFQVKANGGVFVLDDFGRQRVQPHDLLNRWIVPLEKREDFLTLHTAKTFPVPFDSLIVFSTNLNPGDLVDEAFLRRIRYKVPVANPTRDQYELLFRRMCEAHDIEYGEAAVQFVYDEYYGRRGIAPRFCHPRDLIEHVRDAFRYHGGEPRLHADVLAAACETYFLQNPFETSDSGLEGSRRPGALR